MVRIILGSILGALAGLVYYKYIGCWTGRCPITPNPWASMLFGVIMGNMIANIGFSKLK